VVEISQGPTITQYGVEPSFIVQRSGKRTKVKVGKIASLADDLALALAARSIRIQAPVPGKGYVGIEVPNPEKALVSLRDVMEAPEFNGIQSALRIGLGQNVAGQPIATDLTQMPHLLIAGTTGSGKSVCVNAIVACLLLQNTPETLKLVMVDPKRVELTGYNGIPHLVAPVVVDLERVVGTLQWAMREMDNRYKKLADVGARNINEYNRKIKGNGREPMPFIVIIIDELADLMMLSPDETERGITRLAQMARATGIHMVIATQRPSVDVVTGLIKANFPARIAFAVASSTDSRVILDTTGAERLLGQGDMLFQSPDAAAPIRMQGCFVSESELNKLIGYWQSAVRFSPVAARTASDEAPLEAVETDEGAAGGLAGASPAADEGPTQQPLWEELQAQEEEAQKYEDDLLPEAIALVRQLGKASTSLLQRRFRIGYTRAARMMDVMEEDGIIGPPTGTSKAREVLPWRDDKADLNGENVASQE
jgi:S-DNA-T family DNA segregation ATPase FtsK/SpoIIIE